MPDASELPAEHPGEPPVEHGPPSATALAQALGGGRGLFDSGLPATVFVVFRIFTHKPGLSIAVAVATGLLVVAWRMKRMQTTQQAWSGFFGLALAAAASAATGTGKGFFLPGILLTAGSGVVAVISLLVRRPLVGVVLAALDAHYSDWAADVALRRACTISTAVWAATFFLRAGVATSIYRIKGDHPALLLIVGNAVKIPAILLAAGVTYLLVKRARPHPHADQVGVG